MALKFNPFTGLLDFVGGTVAGAAYSDEQAQDAVGNILTDTAEIDFTYDDLLNTIIADLKTTSVTSGSYGSASQVGAFTVDTKGRLTAASNINISLSIGAIPDFTTTVISLLTDANIPDTITIANITQITTRSHASLQNLSNDDHTQYLLAAGTRELTGNWGAGAFQIKASKYVSTVATGTQPFECTSTTLNTNLNADMVDSKHIGVSGNTIPLLDSTNTWSAIQTFPDTIYFGRYLIHAGDTNTYIEYTDDNINIYVGGLRLIQCWEAANDAVSINPDKTGVDFYVHTANAGLSVDESTDDALFQGYFHVANLGTDKHKNLVGGTLYSDATDVGNVGTGEDELYKVTIFSNLLYRRREDYIYFYAGGICGHTNNNKRIRVYFGSTVIYDTSASAEDRTTWFLWGFIYLDASGYQRCMVMLENTGSWKPIPTYTLATEDCTADSYIKITGEATSNDDIVQKFFTVKVGGDPHM